MSRCPKVLPHVEPPAAPPIQQRDASRIRDDAQQTIRHRTWDPHQLLLLRVSPSLRSLPSTRTIIRSLEESMGRQSDQHRGIPAFATR